MRSARHDPPEWLPQHYAPPPGVGLIFSGYWLDVLGDEPVPYEVMGKYMFFSTEPMALLKAAETEIAEHGFHVAKVNATPMGGREHVMCLYYVNDSRRRELADRNRELYGLKYRWWKSDADTEAGKYSERFLSRLDPSESQIFSRPGPKRRISGEPPPG